MQFWPLGIMILVPGVIAFCIMFVMMKMQRSDVVGRSPHHRSSVKTDLLEADEHKAATHAA